MYNFFRPLFVRRDTDASQGADGDLVAPSVDSFGNIKTKPASPTSFNLNSAATTNATSVSGSPRTVYSIVAGNINAAARYLKLYDKAAAPVVGVDTPVLTIPLPAGDVRQVSFGALGHRFANGVALAITAAAADADVTAVAAGDLKVTVDYA